MGTASSRPRPRPGEQVQAPFTQYSGPPPPGPYFLGGHNVDPGAYNPSYQNNGQYYGGLQGARNQTGHPNQGPQHPGTYPGQNTLHSIPGADKQLNQTATIRNSVNVKKTTILLTPLADDPQKLAVSFQFDASAPCIVSVFVAAAEDTSGACRVLPSKQVAVQATQYEKGLGLCFPKPGAEAGAVIDVSLYEEEELLNVKEGPRGAQYPLVIRLETVTEKGVQAGRSLSELVAGGPQTEWVQSQTTFAQLVKDEGKYRVRTLKQNIWLEGVSYMLQEIYGIEQAIAAAKEREGAAGASGDQEEERNCVICMVNARDTVVSPCRHMCVCHDCALELRKQTSKCPICRNHVESLLRIRMERQQAPKNPATPVDQSTVSAALDKLGLKASPDKAR